MVRRISLHPAQPPSPDGIEAFIQFVEGFAEQFPQMSIDIKRAVAENDMVVEHRDVLQPVPESAANDHPMF